MNFRRSAGISAKEKVMAEERFDNESLDEFPLLMSPTAKIPARLVEIISFFLIISIIFFVHLVQKELL